MSLSSPTIVVTTIQPPTRAMTSFSERTRKEGVDLIVIGDRKGPAHFELERARFHAIEDQLDLEFSLARLLPTGHYARKNLGYLIAFSGGADCIYETDDDNEPTADWKLRERSVNCLIAKQSKWVNAYQCFTNEKIWPRGYPLDELADDAGVSTLNEIPMEAVDAPIQQGLANGSPDVDAIWRLVMGEEFSFHDGPSVQIPPGAWCPFNSQSTWWWPEAYPLMYLPSHCSFRMTDIWRSFIAQRCLWELGDGVVFHAPEVYQARNEHDLMRDFEDEVAGYLRNKELTSILDTLQLESGLGAQADNLLACYRALIDAGFFPESEWELVRAWVGDLERLGVGG